MATVTVTIPDSHVPRVLEAARGTFPGSAGLPNSQLGQYVLAELLRRMVWTWETQELDRQAVAQDTTYAEQRAAERAAAKQQLALELGVIT